MVLFYLIASFKVLFLSAVYGRVDGGGIAKVNEWLERFLVMSFFVLACSLSFGWWALFALVGMVGIATGHGQYFLNRKVDATEPEKVDFICRLFFGRDPRTAQAYAKWRGDNVLPKQQAQKLKAEMEAYDMGKLYMRCVFGMFLTGQLVGLPAAILAAIYNQYDVMAAFLLTGCVKSFSYVVSYEIWRSTVQAEYINGAGRGLICIIAGSIWM